MSLGAIAAAKGVPKLRCQERPNIIFIMLDDLGKEWVGCYGSKDGLTPNADVLAAQGMKFNNVYSMPVCVPTRTTFLTGQYPARHGWKINWNAPVYGHGYFDPAFYPSIARVVRAAGYATAAAGKWQINDFRVHPDVLNQLGFDAYCMWTGPELRNPPAAERYWNPYVHTKRGSRTRKGKFGEDVFVNFLTKFMERHKKQPMMLYYPMCLPHTPLVSTPLNPDVVGGRDKRKAMVRYADFKLGHIVEVLDSLRIRDKTIIIWASDNGSPPEVTTTLDGKRVSGGKGTLREGGINVPFVISCPGLVPAGVASDALIDFTDLLPTFAELAQAQPPGDAVFDGQSFARHLLGFESDGPRHWIMSMAASKARLSPKGRLVSATRYSERVVRDKRYKLWTDEDRRSWKLIDLARDPEEINNLLDSQEPQHRRARARLERVVRSFSQEDSAPRYEPLPLQPWDVPAEEAVRRFNREPKKG